MTLWLIFNPVRAAFFYCLKQLKWYIPILLHTSIKDAFSTLQSHVSAPILTITDVPFLLGLGVLALVIVVITHGRLGYTQELLE